MTQESQTFDKSDLREQIGEEQFDILEEEFEEELGEIEEIEETETSEGTETSNRFTKNIWKNIRKIDIKVKEIITMLASLIILNGKVCFPSVEEEKKNSEVEVLGELFEHAKNGTVPQMSKGGKKGALNTVAKIKLENSLKHIKKNIDAVKEYFNESRKESYLVDGILVKKPFAWDFHSMPPEAFHELEIRGFALVCALKHATKKYAPAYEEQTYGLLVTALKFVNILQEKGTDFDSLRTELLLEIERLKNVSGFIPENILKKYPQLTVYNNFDKILPGSIRLSPMSHQVDILNQILANFVHGFILQYVVMAGYGKTTSAVSIAKIVELMNKMPKFAQNRVRLVFVCNIDSVRLEVARYLFHTGITFGVVGYKFREKKSTRSESDWYIRNSELCGEKEPTVLISGPEFASDVIRSLENNGEEVILFLDEPTVGADTWNSFALRANAKLLANLPKRTILSTATFPNYEDIKCVFDIYRSKFPHGKIDLPAISRTDIKIGCSVFTYDQAQLPIFSGASTQSEAIRMSENIKSNPFLKRMCTLSTLRKLNSKMGKKGMANLDWTTWASDISNLNPNAISKSTTELLARLGTNPSCNKEEIEEICRLSQNTEKGCKIKFSQLLENWTTLFDGMSLIATKEPIEFAKKKFANHLEKVNAGFNLDVACAEYDKAIRQYQELLELKRKAEESAKKKTSSVDSAGNATRTAQSGGTETFSGIKEPKLVFPEKYQINTEGHCKRTAKTGGIACQHKKHICSLPVATDRSFDNKYRLAEIHFDHDLVILLLCGIGVWSKNIKNEHYRNFVLEYASEGRLSYVIADESICFGTNYPFTRVFVTSDFAECHSMETIMQVIARGGRLGLSYEASAYLPDCLFGRLQTYVETGKDSDLRFNEGKNLSCQVMLEFKKIYEEKIATLVKDLERIDEQHQRAILQVLSKEMPKTLEAKSEEKPEANVEKDAENEAKNPRNVEDDAEASQTNEDLCDNWEEIEVIIPEKVEVSEKVEEKEQEQENTRSSVFGSALSGTKSIELVESEPQKREIVRSSVFGSALLQVQSSQSESTGKYVPPAKRAMQAAELGDLRSVMGSALTTKREALALTTGKYVPPSRRN
jgi:hypothetical protein